MQLSCQSTSVACIGKEAADKFFACRDGLAILPAACGARITPGEEGCPAGCADGALAIGLSKRHTLCHKAINVRRIDVRIAQCADGVVPLLIGADPQDVRLIGHVRWINQLANLGELCLSIG